MKNSFTKGVERLVDPVEVGTLHFIQFFNNLFPKSIQKKMVANTARKAPYMGFVVEPYSYFLFYEIMDLNKAKEQLPHGFKLIKTKVFEQDEPRFYGVLGCFNAHTSGFWGMRIEFYVIAEDEATGLLSWIIVDVDTNTITYDPKNGLKDPNATGSLVTIDHRGMLHADVRNNQGRRLIFSGDITEGEMTPLDHRLWVEGNLSVTYGRNKQSDDPQVFSLRFDPLEFEKALELPLKSLTMEANDWYRQMLAHTPSKLVCFPYAQHLLSDSPGHFSAFEKPDKLKEVTETFDFEQIEVFSTKSIKRMFLISGVVSTIVNTWIIKRLISGCRKK